MIENKDLPFKPNEEDMKAGGKCSCNCGCACSCPSGDSATNQVVSYPFDQAGNYTGNQELNPG